MAFEDIKSGNYERQVWPLHGLKIRLKKGCARIAARVLALPAKPAMTFIKIVGFFDRSRFR
jgi:hypothetical protein